MGPEERERIEAVAERVLGDVATYIWGGRKPPVPVEDIADSCFGLHVLDKTPAQMRAAPGCPKLGPDDTLSGLLLPSRGEIWVNREEAAQWPPRRRFTIAHEIGHHVMHRGQQALSCRSRNVQPDARPEPAEPDIEEEASVFAAALLMPAEMMRRWWPRLRDHAAMCEMFDASKAAMGKRLHTAL